MNLSSVRTIMTGAVVVVVLGAAGCLQVYEQVAKTALEDRSNEDHSTDVQIATGILSALSDKDKSLLLDVNSDVWEMRVMLTGTLDNPETKGTVERLVRADQRVKTIYNEIQIVSKAEQEQRREAAKNKEESKAKKEGAGQAVNDFWIETKINAQLISARGVTSVNYRWRSVRNVVYLIGRARSEAELQTVLDIIRKTEGVTQVKHFVEVKPVAKS